ncbi:hypothetical protein [Halobellus sp.]
MIPEFVVSAILAVLVFGGLAFHDAIADRVAAVSVGPDVVEPDDLD